MSSVAGSPAKMSALPDFARASGEPGVGYGARWRALLAKYVPALQSWKTSQACLIEGSATFSETWPQSGMMQSGIAYRLPTLALPIHANEFGWWPTPRASDRDNCGGANARKKAQRLGVYIGRNANPHVNEWLMGYPNDWSALPPSETE